MKSILSKNQKQTFIKTINFEGEQCKMSVTIRYDDEYNNGHNSFSITGEIKNPNISMCGSGSIHEEIAKYFPEFKHLIKWHLCSSDGPLHYISNTKYWVKKQ